MYQKILAPLDGSEFSECSLQHVKAIATGCQVPEVILLRVVEPIHAQELAAYAEASIDTSKIFWEMQDAARKYIGKVTVDLKKGGLNVQGVVTTGWSAQAILDYAMDNKVDLIIMSTHGRSGPSRWLMGSVTDKIVRHSPVPVLTISPPGCRTVK
jgi:nucleotide-binding universal stress UspA family protein